MTKTKAIKTKEEIITDAEIDAVWGNADFGDVARRKVIDDSVVDTANGFEKGRTVTCILKELGLTGKAGTLTLIGYQYLWAACGARLAELEEKLIAIASELPFGEQIGEDPQHRARGVTASWLKQAETIEKLEAELEHEKATSDRIQDLYNRLAKKYEELQIDGKMLDWLQSKMTPADSYCEIFFAGLRDGHSDAESFQIESNPERFKTMNAPTIREVIIKAMTK